MAQAVRDKVIKQNKGATLTSILCHLLSGQRVKILLGLKQQLLPFFAQ